MVTMGLLIKHKITDGITDAEFYDLCAQNRNLKFERTAERNIIVMSPAHTLSGGQNAAITGQLRNWNKAKKPGKVFDSSSGFTLPHSAVRSPDACYSLHIFRPNKDIEIFSGFNYSVSANELLPGFELDLPELETT
jgi:hypothetical protein